MTRSEKHEHCRLTILQTDNVYIVPQGRDERLGEVVECSRRREREWVDLSKMSLLQLGTSSP